MKQTIPKSLIARSIIEIGEVLSKNKIPYCIVGALAVGIWGEVRSTRDLDFLVLISSRKKNDLLMQLNKKGYQFNKRWAKHNPLICSHQTRLLYKEKIVIDLMEPRNHFDKTVIKQRKRKKIFGKYFNFPSPENLLLMKLKVGRPRDFEDALSILLRQKKVNQKYMIDTAIKLGIFEEVQFIMNKANGF